MGRIREFISIDGSYAGNTPFVAVYRSERVNSNRSHSNPSQASLMRIRQWARANGAEARIWVTSIGWSYNLFIEEGDDGTDTD